MRTGRPAILALCICLTSCASVATSTAYKANCKGIELCMQTCKPLTDWTGDKDDEYIAWLLGQHSAEQAQCDAQRGVCAECLDKLSKAGVIE